MIEVAYVTCHVTFKDEVGSIRIVQGLKWTFLQFRDQIDPDSLDQR